jgi:uncharacterized repeat protein (TIGR03803 family)
MTSGKHELRSSTFSTWNVTLRTATVLFLFTMATVPAAQAQTYTILGNFGNKGTGVNPLYVTLDEVGNVYGTTYYGGLSYLGYGVVFKLTHHGSHWLQSVLYDFSGGNDGGNPYGGVVFGPDGALYGTTSGGGLYGEGVVFKLQPSPTECPSAQCRWTETVLYNFTGAADGAAPQGNIIFDRTGNLYGTTLVGGSGGGWGTTYELSPAHGQWSLSVLHTFTDHSDGGEPGNGVIFDQAGNLYGTTVSGGSDNKGVVYELTPGSSGWTQTILHNFAGGSSDGAIGAGVAFDSHGNLFGFTEEGGYEDWGVTFELQPADGGYNYSVIYLFMPQPGGAPGYISVPVLDSAGNLYGSGTSGGSGNAGVAFELTPSDGTWNFVTLHDFSGPDGDEPGGNVILDPQGNVYGCAEYGGGAGEGVVWQIMP